MNERAMFVFDSNDEGTMRVTVQVEGVEVPPQLASLLINIRHQESAIQFHQDMTRLADRQTNAMERIAAALEQPITIKEESYAG